MIALMPRRSLSSGRAFWLLQAGGWTAFVVVLVFPWLGAYPLGPMLVRKIPMAFLGLVTTLGLRWVYQRLGRSRRPVWMVGVAALVGSCAASWLWALGVEQLAPWLDPLMLDRGALIRVSLGRFPGAAYYAIVLVAWSVLYFGLIHARALTHERQRALRAEAAADRARLQALRHQLNPHFLFNTLNAISTLVVEQRIDDAQRMIGQLGAFLRLTLDSRQADEIPLTDELEFVRRYLEIEVVRFEHRLATQIDAHPAALDACVPAMILQPIVENALRHSMERDQVCGRVTVAAVRRHGVLRLSVTDNGLGLTDGQSKGYGIGLSNTRARLQQHYGDAHSLELVAVEGGGVRATIELPYTPVNGR
jgi:two-component system, LytTR family, sensor kinase